MAPVTVAWFDQGARIGVCVHCIIKPLSERPELSDLTPGTIEDARGKACVICNLPLAYEPGSPAAMWEGPKLDECGFLPVDGIELLRDAQLAEEERDGDWLADEQRLEEVAGRGAGDARPADQPTGEADA